MERFVFPCQCEDSKVDALGEALQTTVSRWKCKFSAPLPLELYTSSNFIGLFVKEDSAEVLKKFAADFAAEAASKTGELTAARPGVGPVHQKWGRKGIGSYGRLGWGRQVEGPAGMRGAQPFPAAPVGFLLKTANYCSAKPPGRMSSVDPQMPS